MEIDFTAQHANVANKDPDSMDTSIENPLSNERKSQQLENSGETGMSAPADHSSVLQPPKEDSGTLTAAQRLAQVPLKPHLRQDLLSVFGLQPLAASVARTDPVTGEKINKMRKSYEGKVKTLGLAGRNRAVKHDPGKSMGLLDMVRWPEEEWHSQKVAGKSIMNGLPSVIMSKLEGAMRMQPGPIPNTSHWEDRLGHEKIKSTSAAPEANARPMISTAKTNGQANGSRPNPINTQATGSEVARPKRTSKKRRYDDLSFEGYGEGYVDDEADSVDAGGYSSGDGASRGSASKKLKMSTKDFGAASPTLSDRGGSYGVGMIGVGSGYGR